MIDREERDTRPNVHSLRGAGRMLQRYWLMMAVSAVSIVLFAGANLARPLVIQRAIDDGIAEADGETIAIAAVIFFVLAMIIYVFQGVSTYAVTWVGQGFIRDLRVRLFTHLQRLSMSFFDKENSGRLVSRMTADMVALQDVLNNGFLMVLQAVLLLVGTVVILVLLSWQLSLITLVILPPLVIATAIFKIYSERAYDAVRDRIADVLIHMQETLSGMRVVQAFARERHNTERFSEINELNFDANVRTVRISSMYIPFIEWLNGVGIGIILYFGGRGIFGDAVTVGTVAAFIFYLDFIFQPIQRLSQVYDLLQSAFAALNKIFGLLAVEPIVREPERPEPLPDPVEGEITFDHVSFSYSPETEVLHDIDLRVPAGQRVALVGPTGAGKSTIAKLSMRFYDPTQGAIRLDGIDLRSLTQDDLRRAVLMVPQEGYLFTGTVRENILFGNPTATDDELIEACRAIGVHEFIESLPEGYDTAVSYRGSSLSAGEKQLVSLARAFLADPAVLILDEATSSLDPGTEQLVERALRRLLDGRTSLIIAHRLSTAEAAHRVLVVEGGRIVEDGAHEELVEQGGHYAALHRQWATGRQRTGVA